MGYAIICSSNSCFIVCFLVDWLWFTGLWKGSGCPPINFAFWLAFCWICRMFPMRNLSNYSLIVILFILCWVSWCQPASYRSRRSYSSVGWMQRTTVWRLLCPYTLCCPTEASDVCWCSVRSVEVPPLQATNAFAWGNVSA